MAACVLCLIVQGGRSRYWIVKKGVKELGEAYVKWIHHVRHVSPWGGCRGDKTEGNKEAMARADDDGAAEKNDSRRQDQDEER